MLPSFAVRRDMGRNNSKWLLPWEGFCIENRYLRGRQASSRETTPPFRFKVSVTRIWKLKHQRSRTSTVRITNACYAFHLLPRLRLQNSVVISATEDCSIILYSFNSCWYAVRRLYSGALSIISLSGVFSLIAPILWTQNQRKKKSQSCEGAFARNIERLLTMTFGA